MAMTYGKFNTPKILLLLLGTNNEFIVRFLMMQVHKNIIFYLRCSMTGNLSYIPPSIKLHKLKKSNIKSYYLLDTK